MIAARKAGLLALLLVALPTAGTFGGTEPTSGSGLSQLAWIAGNWEGGDESSLIQEQWSPPAGDNMMGMFRLVQEGQVVFYEFMSIELEDSGPVLRIKHFDPGLAGWEEKDDSVVFTLQEIGEQRVVFGTEVDGHPETLVFERSGEELVITLIKPVQDSRTEFRFQRR